MFDAGDLTERKKSRAADHSPFAAADIEKRIRWGEGELPENGSGRRVREGHVSCSVGGFDAVNSARGNTEPVVSQHASYFPEECLCRFVTHSACRCDER